MSIFIFEAAGLAGAYWTYSILMVYVIQEMQDWITAFIGSVGRTTPF